jgi:hypothetical protein
VHGHIKLFAQGCDTAHILNGPEFVVRYNDRDEDRARVFLQMFVQFFHIHKSIPIDSHPRYRAQLMLSQIEEGSVYRGVLDLCGDDVGQLGFTAARVRGEPAKKDNISLRCRGTKEDLTRRCTQQIRDDGP